MTSRRKGSNASLTNTTDSSVEFRMSGVIGGIERPHSRRSSCITNISRKDTDTQDVPLKSNLKKKHDEVINIMTLSDRATNKNQIPLTIMNTIVKDTRSLDAIFIQEMLDICIDNVFLQEEEEIEECKFYNPSQSGILKGPNLNEVEDIGLPERYFAGMVVYMDEIHIIDLNKKQEYTKAEILDMSIKLASKLQTKGITQNDVIVICSGNHYEQQVALLGSILLGAITAPIDTEMTLSEYSRQLGLLAPKVIFCDPRSKGSIEYGLRKHKLNPLLIIFSIDKPLYDGFDRFISDFEFKGFIIPKIENPRSKIAVILPTVGATGLPKLCAITHYSIVFRSFLWKQRLLKGSRKIMSWFPLCWFMQMLINCTCFELPVTQVLQNKFSERNACRAINEYQVDRIMLGAVGATKLSNHIARIDYDLGSLRVIILGGTTACLFRINALWQVFHFVRIFQCYGCTETGVVTMHCINDSLKIKKKVASCGLVTGNNTIRVIDIEKKELLPPNIIGLILIKADGMMKSYYKNPELTKLLINSHGFINTQDVGYYSLTDHIHVKGKYLDLVYTKEITTTPIDMDQFLIRHPNIDDIVSVTNGIDIVTFIIKRPDKIVTASEIYFLLERHNYPKYLIPKKIIFTDVFPRTSFGKVKTYLLIQAAFSPKSAKSNVSL